MPIQPPLLVHVVLDAVLLRAVMAMFVLNAIALVVVVVVVLCFFFFRLICSFIFILFLTAQQKLVEELDNEYGTTQHPL